MRDQTKCTGESVGHDKDPKDAWEKKLPPRHPAIDEKGKLIKYPQDHPMYRPNDEED